MNHKIKIIAFSVFSVFASANTNTTFMAIIGIEESIAKKAGTIEKNITSWVNIGQEYSCSAWTPNVNTIDYGVIFEQSQNCSQNQTRTKDVYTVYNTGAEVYEKTITDSRTIIKTNTQDNTGVKNFIHSQRTEDWSQWTDHESGNYDCEPWSPDVSTINYGESFTQTRDCKLDQNRHRDTYDVWKDNTETYNSTEQETRVVTNTESQDLVGNKDYITGTSYDSWSSYSDYGALHSCGSYTPSASTVYSGTSFTQTKSCKQDQRRSRNTYNTWASGNSTYKTKQYGYRTLNESVSRTATGTKTPPYSATKSCPSGYSISAYSTNKCYRNDAYMPEAGESCPSGWTLTPWGRCAVYTNVTYSCNSGDRLSGSTCYP